MNDSYEVFSKDLDAKTLEKAKKDLNENVKQREIDIENIKEWILKQTYMNSMVDDDFIIRFLRASKYSYAKTQEQIKNFWINRTEITKIFQDRSFEDDSVTMEIADLGIYFPLLQPDSEGRIVLIQRIGMWDTEKYDFYDIAKYMFSVFDIVSMNPRAQINGIVILADFTGFNTAIASNMSPARAQLMSKCFQDMYPIRIKGLNYYNYPKIFDAVFAIIKVFLKEKLKSRIKFHGPDLKSVHKSVQKSILPKEYGGESESIKNINEKWVEYFKSKKSLLYSFQNYKVDLDQLAKEKTQANSKHVSTTEVTGAFRKLNVD